MSKINARNGRTYSMHCLNQLREYDKDPSCLFSAGLATSCERHFRSAKTKLLAINSGLWACLDQAFGALAGLDLMCRELR